MITNITPLTVIGGFLGAGKTTLVNHLLRDAQGIRFAVLVNDFGDLAIDEELITRHDGETIALANGCVCCSIGDDLVETIMDLMQSDTPPEHLVIEASGVANPGSISELGSLIQDLARDLTLIVVDAEQVVMQWSDELLKETVDRQINSGDLIVLNKLEALNRTELSNLEIWLDIHAAGIPRIKARGGRIPIEVFTNASRDRIHTRDKLENHHRDASGIHQAKVSHQDLFQTITLTVASSMTLMEFKKRAAALPPSVLRAKGFVCLDGVEYLLQKVGQRISVVMITERNTVADIDSVQNKMINRIVLIGVESLPSADWFE